MWKNDQTNFSVTLPLMCSKPLIYNWNASVKKSGKIIALHRFVPSNFHHPWFKFWFLFSLNEANDVNQVEKVLTVDYITLISTFNPAKCIKTAFQPLKFLLNTLCSKRRKLSTKNLFLLFTFNHRNFYGIKSTFSLLKFTENHFFSTTEIVFLFHPHSFVYFIQHFSRSKAPLSKERAKEFTHCCLSRILYFSFLPSCFLTNKTNLTALFLFSFKLF